MREDFLARYRSTVMSDLPAKTCGDWGGELDDGSPCGRVEGWGTVRSEGRCRDHPEEPADEQGHLPDLSQLQKEARQAAFLEAFALVGNISQAARITKISRRSHHYWMEDPVYAERFYEAQEEAADRLEQEAWRRSMSGIEEPVYYGGEQVGTVRRYSDTLLIFLLKGHRPEKFADRFKGDLSVDGRLSVGIDVVREIQRRRSSGGELPSPGGDLALPPGRRNGSS